MIYSRFHIVFVILLGFLFGQYRDIPDVVTKVATSGANWLKIESGARGIGMGGSQVASGMGVSAIPYNPASITYLNKNQEIMYFSRNDIPANPTAGKRSMLKAYHLVSFRRNMLEQFASWERTPLEKIEVIEYLRILEKGHKIACKIVDSSAISVDTLEDLKTVSMLMKKDDLIDLYKHTL